MNAKKQFDQLSEREKEVLDLFCQGFLYSEIAERLVIAEKSIRSHMAHIYQKLNLMHLPPRARAFTLREEYWPILKAGPKSVNPPEPEIEIIEPIPADVEEMIDEDQGVMKALVVAEQPKPRPRRRVPCSLLVLLGIAGLAAAFFAFGGPEYVQAMLASGPTETPTATQTQSELVAVPSITEAPITPSQTSTTTSTATDTLTPSQTMTQTLRPSPTFDFGPIYELGEWHKEGDLWYRLFDYSVDWEGIYIVVEMWNKSSQTEYFHWSTEQNMYLRDNQGNKYTVDSRFQFHEDDEIVPAGAKMVIGSAPYDDQWTNWYDPDNLFLPGVTDLYLTLEYFSDIERATWHISVGD